MNLQSVVEDLTSQGQKAARVSYNTIKQANEVVFDGVQSLYQENTSFAKNLYSSAKAGFEKARADGVKAVVSSPISYLPPSDKFFDAFKDSRSIVINTGDDLLKLVKAGYASLVDELEDLAADAKSHARSGKTDTRARAKKASAEVEKVARKARSTGKRTVSKAKSKAEKAKNKVEKAVD